MGIETLNDAKQVQLNRLTALLTKLLVEKEDNILQKIFWVDCKKMLTCVYTSKVGL